MCPVCGTLLELAESPQAQQEKAFVSRLVAAGRNQGPDQGRPGRRVRQRGPGPAAGVGLRPLGLRRTDRRLPPRRGGACLRRVRWRRDSDPPDRDRPAASGPARRTPSASTPTWPGTTSEQGPVAPTTTAPSGGSAAASVRLAAHGRRDRPARERRRPGAVGRRQRGPMPRVDARRRAGENDEVVGPGQFRDEWRKRSESAASSGRKRLAGGDEDQRRRARPPPPARRVGGCSSALRVGRPVQVVVEPGPGREPKLLGEAGAGQVELEQGGATAVGARGTGQGERGATRRRRSPRRPAARRSASSLSHRLEVGPLQRPTPSPRPRPTHTAGSFPPGRQIGAAAAHH